MPECIIWGIVIAVSIVSSGLTIAVLIWNHHLEKEMFDLEEKVVDLKIQIKELQQGTKPKSSSTHFSSGCLSSSSCGGSSSHDYSLRDQQDAAAINMMTSTIIMP